MATDGTPIVSPTPAVVLRTGSGSTEGNYVYTANPGGETFVYMHLNHVGEGVVAGAVLETGSLIGYVGNTGNASGGPAHLHFEIHTGSRTAVDPFPRLTREFTPAEKISYLSKILNQTSDPRALAQFLVSNFRATFKTALANNISVPTVIVEYLALLPETSPTPRTSTVTLPAGDVALGSTGVAVVELQKYLIAKASGVASSRLAVAGATGYFGAITESALIEYQKAVGITPATGYFGPATRAIVGNISAPVATVPVLKTPTSTPLTRDLYKNLTGEDVRTLQKTLNRYGNIVATSGIGSPGNESTYFGPATEKAVIAFQIAHNIKPSVGYVGLITRTALLALG
ncbi:MAG: peptidoglycan-binding protein, partial [Candidatus Paceibacterota bacterium]